MVSNVIADIVLLLILYLLFSLMGYAVSLTGLLLVVVAVVAAGVRSIVKGTDHSVFALVASLIEGLALLSLFTISIGPTSFMGVTTVSLSPTLYYIVALSIVAYLLYTMIDDTLSTD